MMKKAFICIFCLVILIPNIGLAAEQPLGKFTREEAINKLFKDRPLEPIEGIWSSGLTEILIVKSSLLSSRKPDDKSDYTVITIDCYYQSVYNRHEVVDKLNKSEFSNIFSRKYILINPTTISRTKLGHNSFSDTIYSEILTRIYPFPQ